MSSTSVAAVLQTRGLSPAERVILWAFAEVSDDAGYSWRAIDTVAEIAELTERHVRRLVGDLRKRGYLDQTYMGGGRGRPALYRVLPTLLIDDPDAKSRARYEERFAEAEQKGGNMSPFRLSGVSLNPGAGVRKGGSTRALKGGLQTPRLRNELYMKDAEPRDNLGVPEIGDNLGVAGGPVGDLGNVAELIERDPDESIGDYLRRAHKIHLDEARQ